MSIPDDIVIADQREALAALAVEVERLKALLRDIRSGEHLWIELNERIDAFLSAAPAGEKTPASQPTVSNK
jgi:hypothetical protein